MLTAELDRDTVAPTNKDWLTSSVVEARVMRKHGDVMIALLEKAEGPIVKYLIIITLGWSRSKE